MLSILSTGCELKYLIKSAEGQLDLLSKKESVDKALKDPQIDDETKRKIQLVQKTKAFAEKNLALVHTTNYDSFVLLPERYVTYAVTASSKERLQAYLWSFPFVGRVPYKGFFKKQDALDEADILKKENLDVIVRGVSAYSTLGWFSDPLMSSMTKDDDSELVDTVIHETTHATIYVKSNADFNERLATFVGEKGTELFYLQEEGNNSPTLKKMKSVNDDSKIFFSFMGDEIKSIEKYYDANQANANLISNRENEFKRIKKDFLVQCLPKLKSGRFDFFKEVIINNAMLIGYKMYYSDHEIFQRLLDKTNNHWKEFFLELAKIKKSSNPDADLETLLKN